MIDDDDMNQSIDRCHIKRFIEAFILGQEADRVFRAECYKRGLDPEECVQAPLLWLSASSCEYRAQRKNN